MSNQNKLMLYAILSFVLFITLIGCNAAQTATNSPQSNIETHAYIITEINESGLYGDSLKDDTGIYLTHDTIEGLQLEEGNKINVSYPDQEFDVITKVTKID